MTLLTCLVIEATMIISGGNYVEMKKEGSINKWKVLGVKRCRKCVACSRKERKGVELKSKWVQTVKHKAGS